MLGFIAEPKKFPLVLVLGCGGAVLLMLLFAVLLFIRHRRGRYQDAKKRREALKTDETNELEMEVQLPENDSTGNSTVSLVPFSFYISAHNVLN